MPPRYAYWTILIDGKATAFRAHDREELLPTFNQLARKNSDIVMRYFARGRLWDNPEQAQWANRNRDVRPAEPRDRGWRPGGQHKDPRARFSERTGGPEKAGGAAWARKPAPGWRPSKNAEARSRGLPAEAFKGNRDEKAGASERGTGKGWTGKPGAKAGAGEGGARRAFGQKPSGSNRKPFKRDQKPFNPEERNTRFEARPKDRRPPKFGAPPGKRGGRWNRPPKRDKPR
jgi:hypothetical protein